MITKMHSVTNGKNWAIVIIVLSMVIGLNGWNCIGHAAVSNSDWIKNVSQSFDPDGLYNHQDVKMAVSGTFVHLVWTGMATDWSHRVLIYARSVDGGVSFELPKEMARGSSSFYDMTWNNFVADGSYVHLFHTPSEGLGLIYRRSADNGKNFDTVTFSDAQYFSCPAVYVTAENGRVAVAWSLYKHSEPYPNYFYCSYSTDGGVHFSRKELAYTQSGSHLDNNKYTPVDAVRSGDYVYFLVLRSYTDSYLQLWSSWDGGAVFKQPQKVTVPAADAKNYYNNLHDVHYSPNIAANQKTVNFVWINADGSSVNTLRTNRSVDGGLTLGTPITLHTFPASGGANAGLETIVGKGSTLFATTILGDNSPPGTFVWRSTNGGGTWNEGSRISKIGWWPVVQIDPSNTSKIHLVNSWHFVSRDSGVSFDGGVNPHFPYSDWQSEQFVVDASGVGHLSASSASEILYRRLADPPAAGTVDKSLLMSATGDKRFDNMQVAARPDMNPVSAMTVEMWFKHELDTYTSFLDKLFTKQRLVGEGSYTLGIFSDFQVYGQLATDKSPDTYYGVYIGGGLKAGKGVWNHIAMTYDAALSADNLKLYVNGLLANTATVKGNILTDTNDSPMTLLRSDYYRGSGTVYMDEVRLWNKALSQSDIVGNMQKSLTGKESGLVAYYNFNDTTRDMTERNNNGILMFKESFASPGTRPPVATGFVPMSGATGVSPSSLLSITFNESVLAGSGDITIQDITAGSPGTVFEKIPVSGSQVTISQKTVTIKPSQSFTPFHKYAVTLPATCLKNSAGVFFQGIPTTSGWRFTTGDKDQAVLSVLPSNRDVTAAAGTATFSVSNTGTGTMAWTAAVTSGSGWLSIQSGASGTNTGTITGTYTANTGSSSRTGTIRVTAAGATGSPKDVTVTQVGATPTEIIFQPAPGKNDGTDDGSIDAGKDAYFFDCNGNWSGTSTTFGGNPRSTCNQCNAKGYIQFNVSTLPDKVDKVYLGVTHDAHTNYCYSMCEANFYFYPVLSPWNEVSLPQTQPQEGSAVFGPINIKFPNDFGKKEYDITEIYRKWKSGEVPNNGLVIYSPDQGCVNAGVRWSVYSSDSTEAAKRPYLRVISDQPVQSASQFLGVWSDGVWIWDKATNKWTMMASTANASMIAAGKVDADTIDDLIGVWPSGLYVRQSTNGQWVKLSALQPTWIIAGDLNNDGRDDVIGSWPGSGVFYWNSINGTWIKLSSPAQQLASGNIGGTRDDLAGVWSDGLWARYSADGSWKKLDSGIPLWITAGDMTGDKRADIIGSYSSGTWYRNSANGGWTKLTTPAAQLAAGDLDGDGRDDLVGIWSNSVYVRYGATGQWQQISTSKPKWITTGKMMEAIQAAGLLEDPSESGEELLDMSEEGPGGWHHPAVESEADGPMIPE